MLSGAMIVPGVRTSEDFCGFFEPFGGFVLGLAGGVTAFLGALPGGAITGFEDSSLGVGLGSLFVAAS